MLDEEWIKNEIKEAHKANPYVTELVIEHIKELLDSSLPKKQLTAAELKSISLALLQKMGINTQETGGKQ